MDENVTIDHRIRLALKLPRTSEELSVSNEFWHCNDIISSLQLWPIELTIIIEFIFGNLVENRKTVSVQSNLTLQFRIFSASSSIV